jgi:hypothetical protein
MKCKTLSRINTNAKYYMIAVFCIFSSTLIAQTITPQNHRTGALLLSSSAYAALPLPNWDSLTKYAPNPPSSGGGTAAANGITLLSNPPIGDQMTEGSCVSWAVGYSALGILLYPKYNCWNVAERSPSYIFNQIKQGGNCTNGSYTTDGLNLIKNQGDCSLNLMPYVNGDCMTQPNAAQTAEAAQNRALKWVRLNTTDYSSMQRALDLGYPIVIAFEVYQSFYDMFNTATAVWNTNYGTDWGGHATCIIGYNNTTGMFKVQNQWGTAGGDHGFFYIPYTFVQSSCLKEAYILYATNPLTPMSIAGNSPVCTTAQYSVTNLPTGANVAWSSSNTTIATISSIGVVTKVGNGSVTITATVTNCGSTNPIVLNTSIRAGTYTQSDFQIVASPTIVHSGVQNQFGLGSWMINDANATYTWSWRSFNYVTGQSTRVVTLMPTGSVGGYVGLSIGNACGYSSATPLAYFPYSTSLAIIASPNPTTNVLNVSITNIYDSTTVTSQAKTTSNTSGITKMNLYDFNSGLLVKQWTYQEMKSTNYALNIVGVKKGVYVLKMERDNNTTSTKILVQ